MSAAASQSANLPELGIPPSPHTVDVSIINTGATIRGIPTRLLVAPQIKGHDWLALPVFSFLVQHPGLNRSLLFDLGIRKDWENLSPALLSHLHTLGWTLHVDKDVRAILDEGAVDSNSIEAVIRSHHHFDHVGNPNTFGPNTSLIVGPGFKEKLLPEYPANPSSTMLESDYAHRELIELNFDTGTSGSHTYKPLPIGRLRALDYFNDGSFYLIDAPGHAIGTFAASPVSHPPLPPSSSSPPTPSTMQVRSARADTCRCPATSSLTPLCRTHTRSTTTTGVPAPSSSRCLQAAADPLTAPFTPRRGWEIRRARYTIITM